MSEFLSSLAGLAGEAVFDETENFGLYNTDAVSRNNISEDHFTKSNRCRILKTLLHGGCSYNCAYCRICKNKNMVSLKPKDLADYFLMQYQKNLTDGIFLSSGIPGDADSVMEEIIETGMLIRKGGFCGYMHLKILPGASRSDIKAASEIATRISINIETTSKSRMSEISDEKDYLCDILKRQEWIASEAPGRHTTQLVVGAAGEDDREIIGCMSGLYKKTKPARIYFSAFKAQKNTPLENQQSTKKWRTNRLYQTDYLIREYGYRPEEFYQVLSDTNFLLNFDPKILLAENIGRTNAYTAGLKELMRIPGIGKKGAHKIINAREKNGAEYLCGLLHTGIIRKKAAPYLTAKNGEYQSRISDY